jgi:hypothetical protein
LVTKSRRKQSVGKKESRAIRAADRKGLIQNRTQRRTPGKVLQSIDNEEIVVTIDGKRMLMKKAEVHFRQLFAKAIKGDLKAARLIANLAAEYFGPDAEGPSDARFIVVPDQ